MQLPWLPLCFFSDELAACFWKEEKYFSEQKRLCKKVVVFQAENVFSQKIIDIFFDDMTSVHLNKLL